MDPRHEAQYPVPGFQPRISADASGLVPMAAGLAPPAMQRIALTTGQEVRIAAHAPTAIFLTEGVRILKPRRVVRRRQQNQLAKRHRREIARQYGKPAKPSYRQRQASARAAKAKRQVDRDLARIGMTVTANL